MKKFSPLVTGWILAVGTLLSSCAQMDGNAAAMAQPSYVAMETNSGRILYASNSNTRRPVGMLANVATSVVALDWIKARGISMNTQLTVPAAATLWPRTNLLQLRPGDKISLRDALHSAIMWDDSVCATTIAHACGATIDSADPEGAFVAQMNQLSRTIGMRATRFKGSNGAIISTSSAHDMALLGMYAIENPAFQAICSQPRYTVTINGTSTREIINSNTLLSSSNHVDGVRAARSANAGACLIATAKRASVKRINPRTGQQATYAQRLLVVILGMPTSQERYRIASELLRNGWSAWDEWQKNDDFADSSKFIILPN